jgi:iron complex transport system ATP-binding protein
MLAVENITYRIGSKTLLQNVSCRFEAGRLNLILGPNGAGKSTLIKAICGQLHPEQGSIFYEGTDTGKLSARELAKVRAVLSQNIDLSFPLKVWEVVMMGRYPHFEGKAAARDEKACEEAMRFFNVYDMAERNYMTLSGGEKQRVHFARIMAQIWYPPEKGSRYLIMDEPLTFLDVYYQYQFMHKIQELLKDSRLVVVGVVHDLNLAARFADHIVLLHLGKVLADGDKRSVLTAENIFSAYLLEPVIREENGSLHLFFDKF